MKLTKDQVEKIKVLIQFRRPHSTEIKKLADEFNIPPERIFNYIRKHFCALKKTETPKSIEKIQKTKKISLPKHYFDQNFIDVLTKYIERKSKMNEKTFMNEEAILTLGK